MFRLSLHGKSVRDSAISVFKSAKICNQFKNIRPERKGNIKYLSYPMIKSFHISDSTMQLNKIKMILEKIGTISLLLWKFVQIPKRLKFEANEHTFSIWREVEKLFNYIDFVFEGYIGSISSRNAPRVSREFL